MESHIYIYIIYTYIYIYIYICSSLQDRVLICRECGGEIMEYHVMTKNLLCFIRSMKLNMNVVRICLKDFFSNTVLIPGPGNIELNVGSLLLKFLWTPFLLKNLVFKLIEPSPLLKMV